MRPSVIATRLELHRWGSGPRRALFLHGLGSSGVTWWRIAEALAAHGFSVCAPDLRGHGLSPKPARYGAGDYASDLAELGRAWDLVVGHSLGGAVAVHAAARDPRLARRLLLLDPVLVLRPDERRTLASSHLAEVLSPPTPRALGRANPRWHPLDAHLKAQAVRQTSARVVRNTLRDNDPWDFRDLALGVSCPTLILGADPSQSALSTPALGAELSAANPAVSYRSVPDTGHSIHRERPAAVVRAAAELMAGATGAGYSEALA